MNALTFVAWALTGEGVTNRPTTTASRAARTGAHDLDRPRPHRAPRTRGAYRPCRCRSRVFPTWAPHASRPRRQGGGVTRRRRAGQVLAIPTMFLTWTPTPGSEPEKVR